MIVIGLRHTETNLDLVADYIMRVHSPEVVLIEKDPEDDTSDSGFGKLESKLIQTVTVIRGDVNKGIFRGFQGFFTTRNDKIFDKYDKKKYIPPKEAIKDVIQVLSFYIPAQLAHMAKMNPYHVHQRNVGFIESIKEHSPDLCVVGYCHASAIKKAIPQAHFISFKSNTQEDAIYDKIFFNLISASCSVWPDEKVIYQLPNSTLLG